MRRHLFGVVGEITTLPGCSQVAVSHAVFLPDEMRGQGRGSRANAARKELVFNELMYDYMLCTVDASNLAQLKVLSNNGWVFLAEFVSRRTGHTVQIWGCDGTLRPGGLSVVETPGEMSDLRKAILTPPREPSL